MIKQTHNTLANKLTSAIALLFIFPSSSFSLEHYVVPNDTLWDLASEHLRSPWDWPYITNLDGSQVEDVYSISNGHVLLIPSIEDISHLPIPYEKAGAPEIVILAAKRNPHKTQQQKRPAQAQKLLGDTSAKHPIDIDASKVSPSTKTTVSNPYYYLSLNKTEGLVRAFIDGQHVTIPVSKLVELYADANPGLDVKKIGNGVAISKNLINELLGLK